jgi:(S)-ureidoglycine aminohydrolase
MHYHMIAAATVLSGLLSMATTLQAQQPADTLTGGVAVWKPLRTDREMQSSQLLKGPTHDLALLDIRAITLAPGVITPAYGSESDELIIVKEGRLDVSAENAEKVLGPGGIAIFGAGARYSLEDGDSIPAVYYVLRFRSRGPKEPGRAGTPLLLDWKEMIMKKTDKGESRQICSQPVTWLGKVDMHATTLNAGEVSHPPHVHRSEEIILMRSGNAREYIGGKYYPAAAGDLLFLPSGVPHALENTGAGRCEYFALQWQL